VDRASVFAWSGGGPSAYRLAVRHPERVASLIALAAVSARYEAPAPSASDRFLFGTTAGQWLVGFLARRAPGQVVEGALSGEGSLRGDELKTLTAGVMADPEQRAAVHTDVAIDFSHSAHTVLPESELIVMNHGTHLAFYADPNAADVQEKARAFLAANS
jgi:pimeloyl-ACP methyl ester carboxylesterase